MTHEEGLEVSQLLFAYKRLWVEKQVTDWLSLHPDNDPNEIRSRALDIAEAHTQPLETALLGSTLTQGLVHALVLAFEHPQL